MQATLPVAQVMEQARTYTVETTSLGKALGLSTQKPIFEPIEGIPKTAASVYNFNFQGAFIGDKDAFTKQIIDNLNRQSELKSLGGR